MLSTYDLYHAIATTIYAHIDELDSVSDDFWTDALNAYYEHLYDLAEKAITYANMVM